MKYSIFSLYALALSSSVIVHAKPAQGKYDTCMSAIKLYFKMHPNGPAEETSFDPPSYAISGQQIIFSEKLGFKVYSPSGITVVSGRSCTYPQIDTGDDDGLTQGIKRLLGPLAEPSYNVSGSRKVSRAEFFKAGGVDVKEVDAMLKTCGKANKSLAIFASEALHPKKLDDGADRDKSLNIGVSAE